MDAPTSVTVAAGKSQATLRVPTAGVQVGDAGCVVTAAIAAGKGYRTGGAAAVSASVTLTPKEQTPGPQAPPQPEVTIAADAESVAEGSDVSFTLTATPAPMSDLEVAVSWSEEGSFLPASRPERVTIPPTGTAALTAAIPDDRIDEQDGSVTVTVEAGSGYTVGPHSKATVAVTDNDPAATGATPSPPPSQPAPPVPTPVVAVAADGHEVDEGADVSFTLSADPAPLSDLSVNLKWTVQRPVANPPPGRPSVTSSMWQDTPPQVAISASSSTATVTVTAPDDNTKQTGNVYVIVEVRPGTGYVRHRTRITKSFRLIDDE